MSPLEQVRAEGERLEAALEAGARPLAAERIGQIRKIVDDSLPRLPARDAEQLVSFAADLMRRLGRKSTARRDSMAAELAALRRAAAYRRQSPGERHAWEIHG